MEGTVETGAVIAIAFGLVEVLKLAISKIGAAVKPLDEREEPPWVREREREKMLRSICESQARIAELQTKIVASLERLCEAIDRVDARCESRCGQD